MSAIGPSLPPQLAAKRKRSGSESSDDAIGPGPPSARRSRSSSPQVSQAPRITGPVLPSAAIPSKLPHPSRSSPRRVIGPALPPAALDELPAHAPDSVARTEADASSSSDDDYGPSLPPPAGSALAVSNRAVSPSTTAQASADSAQPQREEWMLAPPTGADWASRIDPTRMKNRKFQTGKGVKAGPPGVSGGIGGMWTETPEEKRRRLEGEVLGSAKTSGEGRDREEEARTEVARQKRAEEARDTKRRVAEYDSIHRGAASLVETHGKKRRDKGKKDDDPSKRSFDYEKDIAAGGLSGLQQQKMLKQAKTMGSRFETGKFL